MKFICAGFPKTGSKSASAAFAQLGFTVADYIETAEFLTSEWLNFIDGRGSIQDVLAAYDRHGFDTNQDFPGNIFWEEMYNNIDNCKVILTVRDNEDIWFDSWYNFFEKNFKGTFVRPGTYFAWYGLFGREVSEMTKIGVASMRILFAIDCCFEQKELARRFRTNKEIMKARYRSHITYVKSVVPEEKLLIWNVKQGWEPVCKFLNVPVPNVPLPRKNIHGELFHEYAKTPFVGKIISSTQSNILKLLMTFTTLLLTYFYLIPQII